MRYDAIYRVMIEECLIVPYYYALSSMLLCCDSHSLQQYLSSFEHLIWDVAATVGGNDWQLGAAKA